MALKEEKKRTLQWEVAVVEDEVVVNDLMKR